MSMSLATVSYIGATILFILSLGGLSHPETSRRGNLYGMIGMAIAVLATIFGPSVTAAGIPWIIGAMAVGGGIGFYAARTVQMTQMPELVALMHSLVGLAVMLVGFTSYIDPAASSGFSGAEKIIHEVEIYIGIFIGAVTFSGSIVAFGKLSGKSGGKPLALDIAFREADHHKPDTALLTFDQCIGRKRCRKRNKFNDRGINFCSIDDARYSA